VRRFVAYNRWSKSREGTNSLLYWTLDLARSLLKAILKFSTWSTILLGCVPPDITASTRPAARVVWARYDFHPIRKPQRRIRILAAETKGIQVRRRRLHPMHVLLALKATRARGVVRPAEEGPARARVRVYVAAPVKDGRRPHAAALVVSSRGVAPAEVRVPPPAHIGRPRSRGKLGVVVALVVVCLRLEHTDNHVRGVADVELIQPPVLASQGVQPGSLRGLDQGPTPASDAAASGEILDGVVGNPVPHVLDVDGRGGCDVQAEERGAALRRRVRAGAGHAGSAADAAHGDERVPQSHIAGVGALEVELHDDGSGEHVRDGKAHVLDVGHAALPGVADLDNGPRAGRIAKKGAAARNGCPRLADDA